MNSKKTYQIWLKLMHFGHASGCHQLPDRSYFCGPYQCPLCSRCLGIFIGEFIVAPIAIWFIPIPNYVSLVLLVPMMIDGLIQLKWKVMSNNLRRLFTGLLFGFGFTYLVVDLIQLIVSFISGL